MEILQAEERYFSQNQTYVTNLGAGGLGFASVISNEGKYTLAAQACGAGITNCVRVTATPIGTQAADSKCGTLGLDSTGTRTSSGSEPVAKCW
jgi:type IV pilus assembly protein PilE